MSNQLVEKSVKVKVSGMTVIERWAKRLISPKYGDCGWQLANDKCLSDDKELYSYGYHFTLARYLGFDSKKGTHLFLKNGDKYSNTTSGHQSETQLWCEGPTVSFTALIPHTGTKHLTVDNILDWRNDIRIPLYREMVGNDEYSEWMYKEDSQYGSKGDKLKRLTVGALMGGSKWNPTEAVWHILGSCLIEYKGKYLLCALDEGSYFVSELPHAVSSIEEAYEALKPEVVREAEACGKEVYRQGEWFFVPTGFDDKGMAKCLKELHNRGNGTIKSLKELTQENELERPNNLGNYHLCKNIKLERGSDVKVFVTGNVRHCSKGGYWNDYKWESTGEHKTVKLGKMWYLAYRNTEKSSFTAGGKVD